MGAWEDQKVPFGCTYDKAKGSFCFCAAKPGCSALFLCLYADGKPAGCYPFPDAQRRGGVFYMELKLPAGEAVYSYTYRADGVEFTDPYARALDGTGRWGEPRWGALRALLPETAASKPYMETCAPTRPEKAADALLSACAEEGQAVGFASCPAKLCRAQRRSYADSIVYRLHIRSFTRLASDLPEHIRGTFDGALARIPYLKELGVTDIELFPAYEFEELTEDGSGRINLWGFTPHALRFAIKAAYGGEAGFRRLLNALHEAGMELTADLYFDGTEDIRYVLDVLYAWAFDYRADSLRLVGSVPVDLILRDPYLKDTGIWYDRMPQDPRLAAGGGFALCSRQFQNTMRRFLKGDGGMLPAAAALLSGAGSDLCTDAGGAGNFCGGASPCRDGECGCAPQIHFLADTDGFTLMDVFSYQRKHNEENGESGRDGADENFSWNCGEEGKSRRKKICTLRTRLYKNALLLCLLSPGTPLILFGDELGRSKGGNNNSWCQDNAVEWLDWRLLKRNGALLHFARKVIALRRAHPVLRRAERPSFADRRGLGLPDVSLHGTEAWRADSDPESRMLAVLFNGAYAGREDGSCDDSFYIGCNMHWEPHVFALPKLMSGQRWYCLIDTGDETEERGADIDRQKCSAESGADQAGTQSAGKTAPAEIQPLSSQREIRIGPRSIVVLTARGG